MSEVVRHQLTRDPTIEITTIGTRSGAPRRIEIWMMVVDERFFITGTPGPRDWLANLRANSELVVHLNTTPPLDVAARATEVTDEATRRLVIGHVGAAWYRSQSSVDELLANAPMVESSSIAACETQTRLSGPSVSATFRVVRGVRGDSASTVRSCSTRMPSTR